MACSLDTICQTAMGVKINAMENENEDYVRALHEMADAIIIRGLQPWLFPEIIYGMTAEGRKSRANLQCIHGFATNVIKEKKNEMLKNERDHINQGSAVTEDPFVQIPKRKAFLELLLEYHLKDPTSFTEADIREEVDTFMFGGHHTTGTGLSWILYCIGLYPKVQARVTEELDEIFQNDLGREVTREDLTKMKYLECTIKETLRLYPVVPYILREINETFKVQHHTIHPGSMFAVFFYALHRDPEYFPDPEKFLPERFFLDNMRNKHPFAYVPFSAGPRNCIGQKFAMMEMKTVLANVLRRLRVTSLDPRDQVLVAPSMVLRNTMPLRLKFETRYQSCKTNDTSTQSLKT